MIDLFEYTISQHYLPAIINGDYSGLSIHEIDQLSQFEKRAFADLPPHQWAHWDVSVEDCTNFAQCDVTGLWSDVSDVRLVFKHAEPVTA